jgi:hypothetical protein
VYTLEVWNETTDSLAIVNCQVFEDTKPSHLEHNAELVAFESSFFSSDFEVLGLQGNAQEARRNVARKARIQFDTLARRAQGLFTA